MWLLDVHTRRLELFRDRNIPPYAILSHRWGDDEVSFHDLRDGTGRGKGAYAKIDMCCRIACRQVEYPAPESAIWRTSKTPNRPPLGQALSYIWIDTCCIDKTSSAELSQAINSMHSWYEKAAICYAYLSDVHRPRNRDDSCGEAIVKSVWFSRGWTLQELIAPVELFFFDHDWVMLGTKLQFSYHIADMTSIPRKVIVKESLSSKEPVAAVFSWAAKRRTTREEDRAYSLLGLLDVNMPLLYGEGFKAFHRLQEILLSTRNDTTILAWSRIADPGLPTSGIFANSPSDYGDICGKLKPLSDLYPTTSVNGIHLGNMGLSIEMFLVALSYHTYMVPLTYSQVKGKFVRQFGMVIERWHDGLFRRVVDQNRNSIFLVPTFDPTWQYVVLRVTLARDGVQDLECQRLQPSFFIPNISQPVPKFKHYRMKKHGASSIYEQLTNTCHGIRDIISLERSASRSSFFLLGLDFEFIPFCLYIPTRYTWQKMPDLASITLRSDLDTTKDFVLLSETDMMGLVHMLRQESRYKGRTRTDGVELFLMPKTDTGTELHTNESTYLSSDGVEIKLSVSHANIDDMILKLHVAIDLNPSIKQNAIIRQVGEWEDVTGQEASQATVDSALMLDSLEIADSLEISG